MNSTNKTYRSIRIRLFPDKEQERLMWKHIDASRFIYNKMIEMQQLSYRFNLGYISKFTMINLIIKFKVEYPWLWLVSNATLQNVCNDVDQAYQLFFNHQCRYPKFKSKKKSKKVFPIRSEQVYFTDKGKVNIEKIGKVRFKTDHELPVGKGKFKCCNTRIKFINNKWILSMSIECDNQTPKKDLTDIPMGIDLGIKELAVVSYGDKSFKILNINKTKRVKELERKKKHIERNISRKYITNNSYINTKNINKEYKKLRKIYFKLSNIRLNHIHQHTHLLTKILSPKKIVMEDLNITGMMKNKHLSKAIANQCLNKFIFQMKYKCEDAGIEFIQVPRTYPSSKKCSCCGNIKKDLKLGDRIYVCDKCHNIIDRDFNAAINLRDYKP